MITNPPDELRRAIGEDSYDLLLESLRDVFRTGYGEIGISISAGKVQTIRTEVSRKAGSSLQNEKK